MRQWTAAPSAQAVEVVHDRNSLVGEGARSLQADRYERSRTAGQQHAQADLTEDMEHMIESTRYCGHSPAQARELHDRNTTAALEGQAAGRRPRTPLRSPHFQVREVVGVWNGMQEAARAPALCVVWVAVDAPNLTERFRRWFEGGGGQCGVSRRNPRA